MQRITKYLWQILVIAILLVVSSNIVSGQTSGTLDGTIIDQNGNPLADALVTVINQNNGVARSSTTNLQGRYRIPFLVPGLYTIRVVLDGYDESQRTNFVVPLNQVTIVVPPIILRSVAAVAITASPGEQALVNLVDATNRANYSSKLLTTLPLGGVRSFDTFALLAPGVLPPPATTGSSAGPGLGSGVGTSGQFAINGRRARSNNFTIDGSDNNDQDIGVRRQGFVSLVPQSIESVNEFQISTQLWDAEQGRNFGAQVNAVSLSGGNDIHATLYGFFTNDRLNARNFFDLTGGASEGKDPLTRTQEGFVIGGPIVRNKTHYFVSFERQDLNARQETHFAVPDKSFRGFNGGTTSDSIGRALLAILPLPNNINGPYGIFDYTQVLPSSAHGTVFSAKITQKIGKSQLTGRYNFTDDNSIIPSVGGAINASIGSETRTQNLSLFLDSTVSDTSFNQVRASYGRTTLGFPSQPGSPLLFGESPSTINLKLLASDIFGFTRKEVYLQPLATPYGTFGPFGRTGPLGQLVITPFSKVGVDPFTFPQGKTNNTYQVTDTFVKTIGGHSLKFGADIKRNQLNSFLDRNFRPQVIFSGGIFQNPTRGQQLLLGSDTAAFGAPSQLFQTLALTPDSTIGLRFTEYNFFAQDNWKINSRMTLDYGIRYEYSTVPEETNNRIEQTFSLKFPPPDPIIMRSRTGKQLEPIFKSFLKDTISALNKFLDGRDKIYRPDRNNFAPRIGLAIDLTGKGRTVLRLGYGLYYDQIIGSVTSQSRNVFPSFIPLALDSVRPGKGGLGVYDLTGKILQVPGFFVDVSLQQDLGIIQNVVQPGTLNTLGFGPGFLSYDLGALLLLSGFRNPDVPLSGGLDFILPDANLRTPYSQHWNVSVEHQFGKDFVASAAYVGSTGTKLIRFRTPNGGPNSFTNFVTNSNLPTLLGPTPLVPKRPIPSLGPFTVIESSASSNFHSLQLSVNKRLSYGLQFGSSYTFSHAIDEVSDVFDTAGSFNLPQDDNNLRAERGSASFDVRHRSVTHFVYDLPFYQKNKLLGGWQFAGVLSLQTGQPFTVNLAVDGNIDGNFTDRLRSTKLVKQVDNGPVRLSAPNLNPRDLLRLLAVDIGKDGAVGRNTFRAPGVASFDLAIVKKFQITERQNLLFRTEFFNFFNRTHFATPVRIVGSPAFGQSVSTSLPARIIQFAIKYSF